MAQKDIQALAEYMESLENNELKYKEACSEAAKEADEAIKEEFDAFEDEMIDKASLGFIDDNDANEADEFYMEDTVDTFEEDISDCIKSETEELDENSENGFITVEVYNEDGFGKHFIDELMRAVPDVNAIKSKQLAANGDIIVKIYGNIENLKKAFAFWTGNKEFNILPSDDKDLFNSLLVFDNGDTLSEADYREAVAHCLDNIDVNASTANLINKDSCALSLVQEEKAKRSAKKYLKALKENDFSNLSDKDLNTLDNIETALANGSKYEDLDQQERKVLTVLANMCGYSLNDWLKFTPEQREKIMKLHDDKNKLSITGFADVHTDINPKTGKTERYRNRYAVEVPKNDDVGGKDAGEIEIVNFNPYYSADDSIYQHPSLVNKKAKKQRDAEWQAERDKRAKEAIKNVRGKDTWAIYDFAQIIQNLSAKQRKNLMKSMMADIDAENIDSMQAAREKALIKTMFGKKLSSDDIGKMWGKSHRGVQKAAENLEGDLYAVARKLMGVNNGLEALGRIVAGPKNIQDKFAEEFEKHMNSKALARRDAIDPEREKRKVAYRASQDATEK